MTDCDGMGVPQMTRNLLDPVELALNFDLRVNNAHFAAHGKSLGTFGGGAPTATITLDEDPPTGFEVGLLTFVAITGLPAMTRVLPGAVNPFLATEGCYRAHRDLDLGAAGRLSTDYSAEWVDGTLVEDFDVTGEVSVPRFVGVEPTIETWTPAGPGRILGNFVMTWLTKDGGRVHGVTATDYRLDLDDELPGVQFREIRIELESTDRHLDQREQIVLFTPDYLGPRLADPAGAVSAAR